MVVETAGTTGLSARINVVGVAGGAVMLSSRQLPDAVKTSTLFPDQEHSSEPRRHVRFATLKRNSVPIANPKTRRQRVKISPKKNKGPQDPQTHKVPATSLPLSVAVQALRKKAGGRRSLDKLQGEEDNQKHDRGRHYDDPTSSQLWGFPVHYSPKKQVSVEWRMTEEQRLQMERVKQEQGAKQHNFVVDFQKESTDEEADYAQYLYLSSLYGPLDCLLYCCCPRGVHGRVYMLLVDVSARKLQRWAPKMVTALRRYWVGHLAEQTSRASIAEGVDTVVSSLHHQRQAAALLLRLQLLRAARALRAWYEYSLRMTQVRERMRLALAKGVETRFHQWRENTAARSQFKHQLKHIGKRKMIQSAFDQWQLWQKQQKKMRGHLVHQWMKTKRNCWTLWGAFVRRSQSAKTLQRCWRLNAWRKQRESSARVIERVYRGYRGRQSVQCLRKTMEVHCVMMQLSSAVIWKTCRERLVDQRNMLLDKELRLARQEAELVVHAEKDATERVESELSKVVRNEMHRKLEHHIQLVKKNALLSLVAKNSTKTREMAKKLLIQEQQLLARYDALSAFRAANRTGDLNSSLCVVCMACNVVGYHEQAKDLDIICAHNCIIYCSLSAQDCSDPLDAVRDWESCARAELTKLEDQEIALTTQLLETSPAISQLWRSLRANINK